ncbi:MAG: hypothetical protein Q8P67_07685, partial [archaeon]|nr:hypothetical protein [archaeon]
MSLIYVAGLISTLLTSTDEYLPRELWVTSSLVLDRHPSCGYLALALSLVFLLTLGLASLVSRLSSGWFFFVSNPKYWLEGIPTRRAYTHAIVRNLVMALGSLLLCAIMA